MKRKKVLGANREGETQQTTAIMMGHGLMRFGGGVDFLRNPGGMLPGIPENATLQPVLSYLAALSR